MLSRAERGNTLRVSHCRLCLCVGISEAQASGVCQSYNKKSENKDIKVRKGAVVKYMGQIK